MPIPDRQQQRREYVRKKAMAYSIVVACAIASLFIVLRTAKFVFVPVLNGCILAPRLLYLLHSGGGAALGGIIFTLFLISLAFQCVRTGKRQWKYASTISYVPPVSKLQSNLPAEEILVRSSLEPEPQHSTILLRAAEASGDKPEQLLRASAVEKEAGI